ncbi:MAG: hypothetical protein GXY85_01230 [Candidatus Brocadiaceae bacterium]|nr:hypothetical protein [Candidatus Brocadiaceae bacterium]
MQQSARRAVRVLALVVAILATIVGCKGALVDPVAGSARVLSIEEVEPTLALAAEAVDGGRYSEALLLLDALRANARLLTPEQATQTAVLWGRARNALHQQSLARTDDAGAAPTEAPPDAAAPPLVPEPADVREAAPAVVPEPADAVEPSATELLAEAVALWEERLYGRAALCVSRLDPRRGELLPQDRLFYDELRHLAQEATLELPPLSEPERALRAREHLDAGLRAFEAGDYAEARARLDMVALFDAKLDRASRRSLERARRGVVQAIEDAREAISRGERLLTAGDLEGAREALHSVKDRGLRLGQWSRELERLLTELDAALAQRDRLREQAERARATDLLERASAAVRGDVYSEASALLADLLPLRERLADEERALCDELCRAVEDATGVQPGLSPAEVRALAERELAAGLEAYDRGMYVEARPHLDKAARLGVSFGWRRNRRLRRAREEVGEALERLYGRLRTGRMLYEARDYEGARRALEEVWDSRIRLVQADLDEVAGLLAAVARIEREEAEARRAAATRLLQDARTLAQKGEHAAALDSLEELEGHAEWLTPLQREEHKELTAAVRKAAERAHLRHEAEDAERMAREADALLAARRAVREALEAYDGAFAAQDYAAAGAHLTEALAVLQTVDADSRTTLRDLDDQVRLRAQALEDARRRQAHLAAVTRALNDLCDDATDAMKTDLLEADLRVREMVALARAEGVQLAPRQIAVRDAVTKAAQEAFRIDRWLRPTRYAGLPAVAERYLEAGEPDHARWALDLVMAAGADMVGPDVRNHAAARQEAARREADRQEAVAARLVAAVDACRAALPGGDLDTALEGAGAVLTAVREEALAGAARMRVLEHVVAFLGTDLSAATGQASPDLRRHLGQQMARARLVIAGQLAPAYLEAGRPEMAEPHLDALATGAGVSRDVAAWARQQKDALKLRTAEAEERRERGLAEDTRRLRELAAVLLRQAQAGQEAQAEATRRELAERQLALALRRAHNALERGEYARAVQTIESEAADVVDRSVAERSASAVEEIRRAGDIEAALTGAAAALDACDVARAVQLLSGLPDGEELPATDAVRRNVLAAVAESALELSERQMARAAQAEQYAVEGRALLDAAKQREEAWSGYRDAMAALLTGRETASAGLRAVQAGPFGLTEFERADLDSAIEVLVEEEQKKLLSRAVLAYNAADYLAAAEALTRLRTMADSPLSAQMEKDAGNVEEAIREKEREAELLYRQAVEAHGEGDAERVRETIERLKAHYARTATYRDRM